jgi:hypothetical protein
MPCLRDSGEQMMRIDVIRKSATVALHAGVLVWFLFAAGCSEPKSVNKNDDPALKAHMEKSGEMYKAKMQEMRTKSPKKVSSGGFRQP